MVAHDPMNIRNRIEKYAEDKDLQMLFKAAYLLGAMQCEMLGKKYDTDSSTHAYGPTGDDCWEKPELVNNTQVNTIFFRIRTARTQGKEERTVLLPSDCEPWARQLYDYFKEKGSNPVFPFVRQDIYVKVKKSKVLQGLEKNVAKRRGLGLDSLRWIRKTELEDVYGFKEAHLEAYGIMKLERRRTPKKRLDDSEIGELKKEYLWKLGKYPEPGASTENTEQSTANLMGSASFLDLDTNWSVATVALQLQEVTIKLVTEKIGLDINKANVEKILNSKFEAKDFGFNQKYEAFVKEVKRLFNVDMPFFAT
jgi:hypothetical protein